MQRPVLFVPAVRIRPQHLPGCNNTGDGTPTQSRGLGGVHPKCRDIKRGIVTMNYLAPPRALCTFCANQTRMMFRMVTTQETVRQRNHAVSGGCIQIFRDIKRGIGTKNNLAPPRPVRTSCANQTRMMFRRVTTQETVRQPIHAVSAGCIQNVGASNEVL